MLKEKLNDGHLLASQAKQKPPKSSDRIKRSLEKITETLENTKQKKSITIAQADQLLKEGEEAM